MENKIKIRKYQPDDARALADIYYHTIHTINIDHYSLAQVNAWAPSLELEEWKMKWERFPPIVAAINDEVVGFAEFEPLGHIDCFYVHHLWQNKGIGSALMDSIKETAIKQNISRIFAEVSITAKSFFERQGFRTVKEQVVVMRGVELTNFVMERVQG